MTATTKDLKVFTSAKKEISQLFQLLDNFVSDLHKFSSTFEGDNDNCVFLTKAQRDSFISNHEKVKGIKDIIGRNHMKCVFFGRTSNGKSSVINAMLRENILPVGIGHTTSCFLQVEGGTVPEPYLLTDGGIEKSVDDVKQLASAISASKLEEDSLVRIIYPRDKCQLLKEEIVLLDSPGIDISPNLDLWIDKYCLDADLFVLVLNGESTLMQTEKNFFIKVATKLSQPNLFVLHNRWDCTADDMSMAESVRKQHLERSTSFLCSELNTCQSEKEAEQRSFFVSARECLQYRMSTRRHSSSASNPATPVKFNQQISSASTSSFEMREGFTVRCQEFEDFERLFAKCISRSAVHTKFGTHSSAGIEVLQNSGTILTNVLQRSVNEYDEMRSRKARIVNDINAIQSELSSILFDCRQTIKSVAAETEKRISIALRQEIRRLNQIVGTFQPTNDEASLFQTNSSGPINSRQHRQQLAAYKRDLSSYTERIITGSLDARCTKPVREYLRKTEMTLVEKVTRLLSRATSESPTKGASEKKPESLSMYLTPSSEFDVAYHIDLRAFAADFHEDINFRFSLSPGRVLTRILGIYHVTLDMFNRQGNNGNDMSTKVSTRSPTAPTPDDGQSIGAQPSLLDVSGQLPMQNLSQMTTSLHQVAMVVTNSSVGLTLTAILVVRMAGWRLVGVVGLGCLAWYGWERRSWTPRAQEEILKKQYVHFMADKMRLVNDMTAQSCSHQLQQTLTSTVNRVLQHVNRHKESLNEELVSIEKEERWIQQRREQCLQFRTINNELKQKFDVFRTTFIDSVDGARRSSNGDSDYDFVG